jgi:hypothetical protein
MRHMSEYRRHLVWAKREIANPSHGHLPEVCGAGRSTDINAPQSFKAWLHMHTASMSDLAGKGVSSPAWAVAIGMTIRCAGECAIQVLTCDFGDGPLACSLVRIMLN